jgi:3-deoxy-manno-octulosonate cytidylyltransferase (CMP-KDO synthetase)
MTRAICVIPVRMASSRFPGKPLASLLGLSLVFHVWHRCRLCSEFERVVIATCDEEIRLACEQAGAEVVMTASTHERATDRTEEAIENLGLGLKDDDLVVMVQGDEVLMSPDMASELIAAYEQDRSPVVNLASRLNSADDINDPNTVKVVAAPDGRVLYFSRAPIPSSARGVEVAAYQQTGVMAFSAAFLRQFSKLAPTPLEIAESVDMLRVLEHGLTIRLIRTETETIGVDTEADRARAERVLADDPLTRLYLQEKS